MIGFFASCTAIWSVELRCKIVTMLSVKVASTSFSLIIQAATLAKDANSARSWFDISPMVLMDVTAVSAVAADELEPSVPESESAV